MSFHITRAMIAHLASFALILQSVELLQILRLPETLTIWSHENLLVELSALPMGSRLSSNRAPHLLAWAELVLAAVGFVAPSFFIFAALLLVHLAICVRFRGSLNGGSDAMTVVVLTGLLISFGFHRSQLAQWGPIYIAIHLLLSYVKAGVSKLRQRDWREGRALSGFLAQSFFADIRAFAIWLRDRPRAGLILCWLVIAFEIAILGAPFLPRAIGLIFGLVVFFHFAIYLAFGLNRFFWIWLSAWPSIFFIAEKIRS